jgi:hypothetical protein
MCISICICFAGFTEMNTYYILLTVATRYGLISDVTCWVESCVVSQPCFSVMVNTHDSYAEGPGFKSQCRSRVLWLVSFSVLSGRDCFYPHLLQFIYIRCSIWCYITCTWDGKPSLCLVLFVSRKCCHLSSAFQQIWGSHGEDVTCLLACDAL